MKLFIILVCILFENIVRFKRQQSTENSQNLEYKLYNIFYFYFLAISAKASKRGFFTKNAP